MLLADKTVIITGASRGIGRAAARECARQGARVVIGHSGSGQGTEAAHSLIEEIKAFGGHAIEVGGDAADPDTGDTLVAGAVQAFGSVDVFVNNAGICPFHSFLDMPREVYLKTVNTNLNGAYFAVQAAANQMKNQGRGGAIIAVSSISALVGGGMQTHYTPTKAGLHSLMQSCAIALGPYGIRCNSVLPGWTDTDLTAGGKANPKFLNATVSRTPVRRWAQPSEFEEVAVFLADPKLTFHTGETMVVDGGYSIF